MKVYSIFTYSSFLPFCFLHRSIRHLLDLESLNLFKGESFHKLINPFHVYLAILSFRTFRTFHELLHTKALHKENFLSKEKLI